MLVWDLYTAILHNLNKPLFFIVVFKKNYLLLFFIVLIFRTLTIGPAS